MSLVPASFYQNVDIIRDVKFNMKPTCSICMEEFGNFCFLLSENISHFQMQILIFRRFSFVATRFCIKRLVKNQKESRKTTKNHEFKPTL